MNRLPIYIIDENNAEMICNSFVASPAHEKMFIYFSKDKESNFVTLSEEKRIVIGVVIAANKPIYRKDENGNEYYISFTPTAIRNIAIEYFKKNKNNLINVNHDGQIISDAAIMIETFFYDKHTHILPTSFGHIEEGSWIASYKIENDILWNAIKKGIVRGFSIEIFANVKPLNIDSMKKQSKLSALFNSIASFLDEISKYSEIKTIDGIVLSYDGELKEGTIVKIKAQDGTETLAPEGSYIVEIEGVKNEIIVGVDGIITSIKKVEEENVTETLAAMMNKIAEKMAAMQKRLEEIEVRLKSERTTAFKSQETVNDKITRNVTKYSINV